MRTDEMEHIKAEKIKDTLLEEYYHFSKRSLNEYKGYIAGSPAIDTNYSLSLAV